MKPIISKIVFLNLLIISLLPAMEQPPTVISRREFQKAIRRDKVHTVDKYLETQTPDPKELVRSLHIALDNESIGSVALLLRHGVPTNEPSYKDGPTPLFKMTEKGNLLLVEWLCVFKANAKLANNQGITPIDIANNEMGEASKAKNQARLLHYNEIFDTLSMPYALLQMRQHRVQVPQELWDQK